MELERHIEVLLLSNDCVIVPGLGGFVAHHVQASYDERDHSFIPPTRTLGFNPQLVINDSLLVQSYIDTFDISYPEALNRIEQEVKAIKGHLSEKGEYEFHGLGQLAYNAEGNLLFQPYSSGILSPNLYGLGLLDFERISTPLFQLTNASKNLTSSSERVVTIKVKTLRKIVAAAVAVFGFFLFANPFGGHSSNQTEATFLGSFFNHLTRSSAMTASEQDVSRLNLVTAEKAATTVETPVQEGTYHIVLACKIPRQNAEMMLDELKSDGINANITEKDGNVMVLYGNYTSQADALQSMKDMSGHKYFNSAWILKSE